MRPITVTFLLCFSTIHLCSQNLLRHYYSQQYKLAEEKKTVSIRSNRSIMEDRLKHVEIMDHNSIINLPIVVNVIYSDRFTNISEDIIKDQIEVLNSVFKNRANTEDFNKQILRKTNFGSRVGSINLKFCLAITNNKSEKIESIRIKKDYVEFSDAVNAMKEDGKGLAAIDPEHILNIWICDLGENNSGYAQMPGGLKDVDGVVIDYKLFGVKKQEDTKYHKGYTLVHLIANYLGLHDIWNEETECGDDMIADTPIHNAPNYGMVAYKHLSTCDGQPMEMYMNFMDNTDDEYLLMFTQGQVDRIHRMLLLDGGRRSIAKNNVKYAIN